MRLRGAIQSVNKTPSEGGRTAWHLAENYLSRYLFYLDTRHLERTSKCLSEAVGETACKREGARETEHIRQTSAAEMRRPRRESWSARMSSESDTGALTPPREPCLFLRNVPRLPKLPFPCVENGTSNLERCRGTVRVKAGDVPATE